MYSAVILSVSVKLDAYSTRSVLFDFIAGITIDGLVNVAVPAHIPPLSKVVIAALVESLTTIPSIVILTLIVLLVVSLTLKVSCGIKTPTPLMLSKVFKVFAVIEPESAAIPPLPVEDAIEIDDHEACENLLTSDFVAFWPPDDGNIADLKNMLKAPLIGAVGIEDHRVCPLRVNLE
jgi:hypothetical protein